MFRAAIAVADARLREDLRGILARLDVRIILDRATLPDSPTFLARLESTPPDFLLIDASQFLDCGERIAERIDALSPRPPVMVIQEALDAEAILGSMRAGANGIVSPPFGPSLERLIERFGGPESSPAGTPGKLIGLLSVKGGCGATTLACHVAAALRRPDRDVLLADLDFEIGILGSLTEALTPYSILDAARSAGRLTPRRFREFVSQAAPGLDVLPAPSGPSCEAGVEPEALREAVRFAASQYAYTIADLGRGLMSAATASLDCLDKLFLVATTDVPALYRCKCLLRYLLNSGYSDRKLRIVLNCVPKRPAFPEREIQQWIGLPVYASVSEDAGLARLVSEGRFEPDATNAAACVAMKITGTGTPYSILDAARSAGRLTPRRFREFVSQAAPGLDVLPAPGYRCEAVFDFRSETAHAPVGARLGECPTGRVREMKTPGRYRRAPARSASGRTAVRPESRRTF